MKDAHADHDFVELFPSPQVAADVRAIDAGAYHAAAQFWQSTQDNPHLSPRMRELVLLAIHGAATSLNPVAIDRHARRARAAGATPAQIVDALVTISTLANHALYASVPILEDELAKAGGAQDLERALPVDFDSVKARFIAIRGFWNPDRDPLARQMPEYFTALTNLSVETWQNGPLSKKEREFLCIAIDCSVTHSYEPGLRLHIRNAIAAGANRDEILAIFQLAAMMGLEGLSLASKAITAP